MHSTIVGAAKGSVPTMGSPIFALSKMLQQFLVRSDRDIFQKWGVRYLFHIFINMQSAVISVKNLG